MYANPQTQRTMKRFSSNRTLRVACLALVAVGSVASGASQTASPRGTNNLPQPYMRVVHPDSDTIQLQIALRQFVPARGEGPAVWLTGASHIGESNYYRLLQEHLDAQGLVLFEGVKERPGPAETGESGVSEVDESSLQLTLAQSLGLAFQLKAINYRRPHFRNSDLSVPELQKLLVEGLSEADAGSGTAELAVLLQIMDGRSLLGAVVNFGVRLLGTSPKLQALAKVTLIETIAQLEGDLSQLQGLPPEMKKLMQVLIESRNAAVLKDLKVELKKRRPAKSVSILYGAGHMPDLERRLRQDLKYRPADARWLTAISVNPAEAGVSEAEMGFVRGLVKWQMQELQKKPEDQKPEATKSKTPGGLKLE